MGTTVTAAYVGEREVTIGHVGDSRAYVFRDGDLIRLTRDHSLVGELVARGKLTEEQAERHPQRSVITRSVGPEPEVQVDVQTYQARGGDVFLVCSDGLTSMVFEDRVKTILEGAGVARAGRARPDRGRQRGRWPGQHHGDPVPARGRGRRRRRRGRRHDRVRDVGGRRARRAAPGRARRRRRAGRRRRSPRRRPRPQAPVRTAPLPEPPREPRRGAAASPAR